MLRWAREVGSASTFIARLNHKKVGNDDMRTFVATVRSHLAAAGCASDDETVWQILRRFQILTFDYDAPGSQSSELALERARHVLEPEDALRASAFWKALTETAIRAAASGGDLDRARLLAELALVDGFRVLGSQRNRAPREALSQAASLAAADLRRNIAGVTLARSAQLEAVRDARDVGRYVEIRGGPGVGKSGLLGMLVQQVLTEARAIVLSPERAIPGGWLAFKSALGIDTSPQAFLSDLASDGGAVLFVDSLDFFDDAAKRVTVIDLVRSAAEVPNFQVIVTVRPDFDKEEPNWLPSDALASLGRAPPVVVKELGAEEIEELRSAAPVLRALLADDHPARDIARNLFRLSRLLEVQGSAEELRSEADLLERWWTTADGAPGGVASGRDYCPTCRTPRLRASITRAAVGLASAMPTAAGRKRGRGSLDRLRARHHPAEPGVGAESVEAQEKPRPQRGAIEGLISRWAREGVREPQPQVRFLDHVEQARHRPRRRDLRFERGHVLRVGTSRERREPDPAPTLAADPDVRIARQAGVNVARAPYLALQGGDEAPSVERPLERGVVRHAMVGEGGGQILVGVAVAVGPDHPDLFGTQPLAQGPRTQIHM